MRLTCPNCGAQYEVPDEVIPQNGRDVQCSSCGDTWFQPHADSLTDNMDEPEGSLIEEHRPQIPQPQEPQATPEEELRQEPPQKAPQPRKRELDPSVADVLREEAALEAEARKHDASPLEEQPDLGLADPDDEVARRSREAQDRMVRMRGGDASSAATAATSTAAGSRRDVLPDIDEINSTLRKDSARRTPTAQSAPREATTPEEVKGGFMRGLRWVLILAVLLVLLYVFAPQISAAVPSLAPVLEPYVEAVDSARLWLDGQMRSLMGSLDGMASDGAENTAPTPASAPTTEPVIEPVTE